MCPLAGHAFPRFPMCGIAGIIDPVTHPTPELLRAMTGTMVRRGPDDQGIVTQGSIGLGHRRLSIIDLTSGHQPMFNEDKSLAIVCNGEIYDFAALRTELENKGHAFTTRSDSEVILHLYEEMGEFCLDRLNGMFAFAIVRFSDSCVFLARDRFGQKPLFFASEGDRFAFASGPAALARLPWVDTSLEPTAIHDFLDYQYIPRPRSVFRGVRKLAPGHWARWTATGEGDTGHLDSQPYWSPDLLPGFQGSPPEAAGPITRLLGAAVERRLVADVPLGAFLSGGLDSSVICALASDALRRVGGGPLKTFSIGFPVAKYDERDYAAAVARHLGTDHHFLAVNPADFSALEQVVPAFEEPFGDASMLPTWLLAQFTRQHVTVALSGDGADELFGGYDRYRAIRLCERLRILPRGLRAAIRKAALSVSPAHTEERTALGRFRRFAALLDADGVTRYLTLLSRFPRPLRESLYTDTMRDALVNHEDAGFLAAHFPADGTEVNRIMELDCRTYLPEDILVKVDRATMAHGLEARSPFLDHTVAETALSLPLHFKLRGRMGKHVLREAFRGALPEAIFRRPKMGFGLPLASWLRHEWQQPVKNVLLSGTLDDYFRRDRLEWLLNQHVAGRADYSYGLFTLTVLGLWLNGNT
ncbi:MAG: asparagine synthase (glutamine-hydrolyzing) [Lentisphaeria bacterium]|nr:asparagine synthase (glutamine-hydrolyzing) [Lentisphaeria bacterium]